MGRCKDDFWKHVKRLDEDKRFKCNFCEREFSGGMSRIKSHLAGVEGRGIAICQMVPEEVRAEVNLAIDKSKTRASSNETGANQSTSTSSPNLCDGLHQSVILPNINEDYKSMEVDEKVRKFILVNNLPLNIVESQSFIDFVNSVAQFGPDYKLPSTLTLDSKLKKEVETYSENVKNSWVKTGCTLIINRLENTFSFIASSPKGSILTCQCYVLFGSGSLDCIIENNIGANHLVQVICEDVKIYNEVNNDFKDLNSKYPKTCIIICVAYQLHCLLLSILDEVSLVGDTIKDAMLIMKYMFSKEDRLSVMAKHMNIRELKYDWKTEHAYYQMLQSMFDNKEKLQQFMEGEALKYTDYYFGKEEAMAADKIKSKDFWNQVEAVLKSLEPIIQVLCLVEDDRASSGYLYEAMKMAKETILKQCNNNEEKYAKILEIFEKAEKNIIHPIHAAAASLNPEYMLRKNFKMDPEMQTGITFVLENFVAKEQRQQFDKEFELYREQLSRLFTERAVMTLETFHPWKWWDCHGDPLPVLQKYAIRILSQPCNSSYKRKSILSDVTSSKEITEAKFSMRWNLVSIRMNMMMMERFRAMEERSLDPIDITKCNQLPDYFYSRHQLKIFHEETESEKESEREVSDEEKEDSDEEMKVSDEESEVSDEEMKVLMKKEKFQLNVTEEEWPNPGGHS